MSMAFSGLWGNLSPRGKHAAQGPGQRRRLEAGKALALPYGDAQTLPQEEMSDPPPP